MPQLEDLLAQHRKRRDLLKDWAAKYHQVFRSPVGAEILGDLNEPFGFKSTFVAGDPYASAFNEGTRAKVEYIKLMVDIYEHPENYEAILMAPVENLAQWRGAGMG